MAYGFRDDRSKVDVYTEDEIDQMREQDTASWHAADTALQANITAVDNRVDNILNEQDLDPNKDSELVDIRTGYDGIVYDTAGNAVREQIQKLSLSNGPLPFIDFIYAYYTINGVGNPLNIYTSSDKNRLSLKLDSSFKNDEDVYLAISDDIKVNIFTLDLNDGFISESAWLSNTAVILPVGYHYALTVSKIDNSTIDYDDLKSLKCSYLDESTAGDNLNILGNCNWVYGYYAGSPLKYYSYNVVNRVTLPTEEYIVPAKDGIVFAKDGYKFLYHRYTLSNTFLDASPWSNTQEIYSGYKYKITFAKQDDSAVSINEFTNIDIVYKDDYLYDLYKSFYFENFEYQYGYYVNEAYYYSRNRICTKQSTYMECDSDIEIIPTPGYKVYVLYFDKETKDYIGIFSPWINYAILLPKEYSYKLMFAKEDNSDIPISDLDKFLIIKSSTEAKSHEATFEVLGSKFISQEHDLINRVMLDKDVNTITFGLLTDTHYSNQNNKYRTEKQAYAIGKIADRIGADFIMHLGDVIEGALPTHELNKKMLSEYWSFQHLCNTPILYTIAHHEMYGTTVNQSWGNDPTACTLSECIGLFGKNFKYLPLEYGDDYSWKCDIGNCRLIGLNSASNTSYGYSQNVVNFLSSCLSGCTKKILLFSHVAPYGRVMQRDASPINGEAILSLINNHTSSDILAFFHGHTHWDNVYKPVDSCTYISTCCALPEKIDVSEYGCSDGDPTSYDRVVGDYSEYCFDFVNVHIDTGVIKTFRFGAGSDRAL